MQTWSIRPVRKCILHAASQVNGLTFTLQEHRMSAKRGIQEWSHDSGDWTDFLGTWLYLSSCVYFSLIGHSLRSTFAWIVKCNGWPSFVFDSRSRHFTKEDVTFSTYSTLYGNQYAGSWVLIHFWPNGLAVSLKHWLCSSLKNWQRNKLPCLKEWFNYIS